MAVKRTPKVPEGRHSKSNEMPSTHQQLLYHVVFSTKNRNSYLANEDYRAKVFAYMAGIAKNLEGFALEIGGWTDHAHLLVRIPAKTAVSDFVGGLKDNVSPLRGFPSCATITGALRHPARAVSALRA